MSDKKEPTPAAAPAAAPAEVKKPKAPSKLKAGMNSAMGSLVGTVKELILGLASPDRPTRRMSILFTASLVGMIFAVVAGVKVYLNRTADPNAEKQNEKLSKFLAKQKEAAENRVQTFDMGKFLVEMVPASKRKPAPGVVNMAEIVVVIECDGKTACSYIENHLTQARDQVTGAFSPLEQSDIMTVVGKQKLKSKIIQKLNNWLPDGKVRKVYFSNMIMG